MEMEMENKTLNTGTDKTTMSKTAISTTSNLNPSPKTMAKRRVSFSFVKPEHSDVTSKDHPSITEEKETNESQIEISATDESLQDSEALREEAGTDNVETGDRYGKSSLERKWSLASSFSIGSKSTRSSRSSLWSNESKWSFGSSLSLARSTIHGDVECIINDLSLHPQFLYWPIPAFFLSIILLMVVFTLLALIFS